MRSPTAIYLAAAATLAGAFWLSAERPAPPAPTPPALVPVTHLGFADDHLAVDVRTDRSHVLDGAEASERVWMQVDVRAVDRRLAPAKSRAVLVIDRSGSMAGEKIASAKRAARRFLDRLGDDDELAIVSYASDVSTDLPLTVLSPAGRAEARRVIGLLEEGGATNLQGALAAAERLLSQPGSLDDRVGRVIVVGDGRPTMGSQDTAVLTEPARRLRERGITVSTLGLGLDYNEDLMTALSITGGGRYAFVQRSADLVRAVEAEFEHLSRTTLRNVELVFPGGGDFDVRQALGHPLRTDGDARVAIGDLASGETRRLFVELVPRPGSDPTLRLPSPRVVYRTTSSHAPRALAHATNGLRLLRTDRVADVDEGRDRGMMAQVAALQHQLELSETMTQLSGTGRPDAIARLAEQAEALEAKNRSLRSETLDAELRNVEQVLETLRTPGTAEVSVQRLIKAQKARSFSSLR